MQSLSGTSRSRSTSDTMPRHMSNKQVVYQAALMMNGEPFTAYDIKGLCRRDLTIQAIGCMLKGIPGIEKVKSGGHTGCSVWRLDV